MVDEIPDSLKGLETSVSEDVKLLEAEETPEKKEEKKEPVKVEEPEKEEEPVKEEEEKEEEVEKPEKGEEKEEEPEKFEEVESPRTPIIKQLAKEHPEILKKYPEIRDMYYREAKFTELFPTVEDAEEAKDKVEDYDELEGLVSSGSPEGLSEFLTIIKENDSEVYNKFTKNLLPALYKQDSEAFIRVTNPIFQNLVQAAYKEGKNNDNENLANAALVVSKFLFGDSEVATGKRSAVPKEEAPKKDESFEKEKKEFYTQKYQAFFQEADGKASAKLEESIKDGLDPNNEFNEFTLGKLVDSIIDEVDKQVRADNSYMARINSLWRQAYKAGFSREWTDKIVSAYLSRANTLVPAIRSKLRAKALEGKSVKSREEVQKSKDAASRGRDHGSSGPPPKPSGRVPSSKEIDYDKTSDEDILNENYVLRK